MPVDRVSTRGQDAAEVVAKALEYVLQQGGTLVAALPFHEEWVVAWNRPKTPKVEKRA